jgi:hypothetical protein
VARWILVEAALHACRTPTGYLWPYQRLRQRRGPQIAKVAMARRLCVAIYHMLRKGEPFCPEPSVRYRPGRA